MKAKQLNELSPEEIAKELEKGFGNTMSLKGARNMLSGSREANGIMKVGKQMVLPAHLKDWYLTINSALSKLSQ